MKDRVQERVHSISHAVPVHLRQLAQYIIRKRGMENFSLRPTADWKAFRRQQASCKNVLCGFRAVGRQVVSLPNMRLGIHSRPAANRVGDESPVNQT